MRWRIAALFALSVLASGLPVSASAASTNVVLADHFDGYLNHWESVNRFDVYGAGVSTANRVLVRLAQPPGSSPTATTPWVCATPDSTQGAWSTPYYPGALNSFSNGPLEAQAMVVSACNSSTAISSGSYQTILDRVPPTAVTSSINAPSGQILPAGAATVPVSGHNSELGRVKLQLVDEAKSTPDVEKWVTTDANGDWTAVLDASTLANGRTYLKAYAIDLAKNMSDSPAVSAAALKMPASDTQVVRPRVDIQDGDLLLSNNGGSYRPEDLSRVPILVTHVGQAATADVSVNVTDGTNTVVAKALVDDDNNPLTPPVPAATVNSAKDADLTFFADVRPLKDGTIQAVATAVAGVDSASGSDSTRLDANPPKSVFTSPAPASTNVCVAAVTAPLVIGSQSRSYCPLVVSGTSTDVNGKAVRVLVDFRSADGGVKQLEARPAADGKWSITIDKAGNHLPWGSYHAVARALDDAGNLEPERADKSNTVDFDVIGYSVFVWTPLSTPA